MKSSISLLTFLLASASVTAPLSLQAEEKAAETAEKSKDAPSKEGEGKKVADKVKEFTQGEAALLLAKKLGLFSGSSIPATPAGAIKLMNLKGIVPPGGWVNDKGLTVGDAAIILVQALGLEEKLDSGKKNDPAANVELIKSEYGEDLVANVKQALSQVPPNPNDPTPVIVDPTLLPVSQEDLNRSIVAITTGGIVVGDPSGTPGGGTNDTPITP